MHYNISSSSFVLLIMRSQSWFPMLQNCIVVNVNVVAARCLVVVFCRVLYVFVYMLSVVVGWLMSVYNIHVFNIFHSNRRRNEQLRIVNIHEARTGQ